MRFMRHAYTIVGILCAVLFLGLAACEKEGPLEKAGRNVDRAVEKVGDKIRDAAKK